MYRKRMKDHQVQQVASRICWCVLVVSVIFFLLMNYMGTNVKKAAIAKIRPPSTNKESESWMITSKESAEMVSVPNIQTIDIPIDSLPKTKICQSPVAKVGFMKTHKTASSTVQNILMRYTMNKEWNFVMERAGTHLGPPQHQYELTTKFRKAWIKNVEWHPMVAEQGYNVFGLHTKWDQKEVSRILGEGAIYITILRDPVDQFESMYNYVHFEKTYKMPFNEFVKTYVKPGLKVKHRASGYLGQNQQLYDLGLEVSLLDNVEAVTKKIKQVEKDFHLVMIAENFEESLVLLSEELCWPLSNMTSLKLNVRSKLAKTAMSDSTREVLKKWLWADQLLYLHFKKVLEMKKAAYGREKMKDRVEELKALNERLKTRCVTKLVNNGDENVEKEFKTWGDKIVTYQINKNEDDCKYFAMSENHFVDYLRFLQKMRWKKWRRSHIASKQWKY